MTVQERLDVIEYIQKEYNPKRRAVSDVEYALCRIVEELTEIVKMQQQEIIALEKPMI